MTTRRQPVSILALAALLLTMLVPQTAAIASQPDNPGGNCADGTMTFDNNPRGDFPFNGVTFTITSHTVTVTGGDAELCVKGSNANSGRLSLKAGETYSVDFENNGGNFPAISNVVVYSATPPAQPGCVDPLVTGFDSKSVVSHTFDGRQGRITLSADLCSPLFVRATTWTYDAGATQTGNSPAWPQTYFGSQKLELKKADTYDYAAPQVDVCRQYDIYASFTESDLDIEGRTGNNPPILTAPGQPYEPPFLHQLSSGPNPTWSFDSLSACPPPPPPVERLVVTYMTECPQFSRDATPPVARIHVQGDRSHTATSTSFTLKWNAPQPSGGWPTGTFTGDPVRFVLPWDDAVGRTFFVETASGNRFGGPTAGAVKPQDECGGTQPEAKVETGEWVDGEIVCDATIVTRERTVTTTPYKLVGTTWVLDTENSTTVTEEEERKLSESEQIPCPQPLECPDVLPVTRVTNVDAQGWDISDAELVDGGLRIMVPGDWEERWVTLSLDATLQELGDTFAVEAAPLQYVGLHIDLADGRTIIFEEEPTYEGKLWSTASFDGVGAGLGYEALGTIEEFVAQNADLEVEQVRVLYTHPDESATTVSQVTFGCTTYEFDLVVPAISLDKSIVTDPDDWFLTEGELEVEYLYLIENTGDETLVDLTLVDDRITDGSVQDALDAAFATAFGTDGMPAGATLSVFVTTTLTADDFGVAPFDDEFDEHTNIAIVTGVGEESGDEVTDTDDATVTVPFVLDEVQRFAFDPTSTGSFCDADAPFLRYVLDQEGFDADDAELFWVSLDPEGPVVLSPIDGEPVLGVDGQPIRGTIQELDADGSLSVTIGFGAGAVLWPGAAIEVGDDGSIVATDWPGWVLRDGEWFEEEDGFSWARQDVAVFAAFNPTTVAIAVSYPAATEDCAGPQPVSDPGDDPDGATDEPTEDEPEVLGVTITRDATGALPRTGSSLLALAALGLGALLLGGTTVRRGRRSTEA